MHGMNLKITRRVAASWLAAVAAVPLEAQSKTDRTSTQPAVHQEVQYKAAPARVYEALLDAKQFAAFTKDTAEILAQPGGGFRLFGGRIEGRGIELVTNKRIVQAWRASNWKPGYYTIVRFELSPQGSGTKLVLDQAGFLEDPTEWKHLTEGWPQMYWEPIRKYLDK
jgi:activator of HSP90 ATPase